MNKRDRLAMRRHAASDAAWRHAREQYTKPTQSPQSALRRHVTGAIERGEAEAITEQPAQAKSTEE